MIKQTGRLIGACRFVLAGDGLTLTEYPKIDENKCVHCYQCIKVCPIKAARAQ